MRTILIDDYISKDPTALAEITDFTSNKLIVKGSTGIGGTSAILSIADKTVIIISPYLGMIQDKENQTPRENNLFIYKGSENTWKDVSDRLYDNKQFILNTTPDQILKIININPSLFEKVKKIPLFIDESHIAAEADYRPKLAAFYHLVFNHWENHFTLSTATPVYNNMDIPDHIRKELEIVTIKRKKETPKNITIFNYRFYQQWVRQELEKGRKVVLFTNDCTIYKNFMQFPEIKIQTLVGEHLEKKIAMYRDADELNLTSKIDQEKDLFILSTKYLTGFDIPFDASVAIISNENSYTDERYINEVVQAYGRIRNTVINAAIFYNRKENNDNFSDVTFMNNFNNALLNPTQDQRTDGVVNHTLVLNNHLPIKLRHQTYNSIEEFAANLQPYGFNPTIEYIEDCTIIPSGITVSNKIQHLRTNDPIQLRKHTDYVFNNIQGDNKDYNGFGEHLLIIYAISYIANACENDWLNNKIRNKNRYPDLVEIVKTFIDVNLSADENNYPINIGGIILDSGKYKNELDALTKFKVSKRILSSAIKNGATCNGFNTLNSPNSTFSNCVFLINTFYVINLVQEDKVDDETKQLIEINHVISKNLKEGYITAIRKIAEISEKNVIQKIQDGDTLLDNIMLNRSIGTYFKHTLEKIVRNLSFQPSPKQFKKIKIKFDKNINTLTKFSSDDTTTNSIKNKLRHIDYSFERQKDLHYYYLLGMASLHIANHMAGFKCSKKHHREYNVVTKVPKALRYKYTPYKIVEVDIRNANAQIIDKIFGTTIGMQAYDNLQISRNMEDRDEAKILYNSTLNNHKLPKAKAIEVYLDAGYPLEMAKVIAERTTTSKVYNTMCEVEETIILKYRAVSKVQNAIRCHDALLMLATPYNTKYLPESVDGIEFRITEYC